MLQVKAKTSVEETRAALRACWRVGVKVGWEEKQNAAEDSV